MPVKPWWASKAVWANTLTVIAGALMMVDQSFGTHITQGTGFAALLTFLGSLGLYGRVTATTQIG